MPMHAAPLTFHLLERAPHELDVLLGVFDARRRRRLQPAVQLVQPARVDRRVGRPLRDGVLAVLVDPKLERTPCRW